MKEIIKQSIALLLGMLAYMTISYGQTPTEPVVTAPVFSARPQVVLVDRILVVVDNDVITAHDLAARVDYVSRQLMAQNVAAPPTDILQKQMLDRMILEKVQMHRARELGIGVSNDHLNQVIRRLIDAQRPGLSVEEFQAALGNDGINFDYFKEDLKKEILISMVREQEIDSRVQISNQEVDNYLLNQKIDQEKEYDIGQIIVSLPDSADEAVIALRRATVDNIMSQLRQGTDFKQLAIQYSETQEAMQGGRLGWRLISSLPPFYAEALARSKAGGIVGPLRTATAIHILKVYDIRTADMEGDQAEQYQVRHILMRPGESTSEAVIRDRLQQMRLQLQEDPNKFADLARQYSQDGSKNDGGNIGWVSLGDTVPEFEAAMLALDINQISEPVETMYGWHILQVVDKRIADSGDSKRRAAAKAALRERKINEMYQTWLQELKDEAFIEYKRYEDMD